ncbi:MAG: DNA-processing protein DprA, partial [Lactococcus cremoris]
GRDIFAIPGNIADGTSDGCNHLIQQGAKLVYQAQDILEEYLYN